MRRRFRAGLLRLLGTDTRRRLAKTCAGFAALALLVWLYNSLDLGRALEEDWLDTHIRAKGAWGYPLFILLAAVVTSVAGPRQLVSFAGGYVYGAAWGVLLSLAGALIGCTINFFAARLFKNAANLLAEVPLHLEDQAANLVFCVLGTPP